MSIRNGFWAAAGAAVSLAASVSAVCAQQTIRVGWTIPAEESKYWMMRRPAEFPDLGKTYNVEWTQFQGTAPMTQALAAGALDCATRWRQSEGLHRGAARIREAGRLLRLLGGHG